MSCCKTKEPVDMEKLRSAVQKSLAENPSHMLGTLAEMHGASEAMVCKVLPDTMAAELDASQFVPVWEQLCKLPKVTLVMSKKGMVFEYSGKLPKGSFGHGMFNIHEKDVSLGGHLMPEKVISMWVVQKQLFGIESLSLQCFDCCGSQIFGVYAGRDEKRAILPQAYTAFDEIRRNFIRKESL